MGTIEDISGKTATLVMGGMRTKLPLSRLESAATKPEQQTENDAPKTRMDEIKEGLQSYKMSNMTQNTIDSHRKSFHQDLDIRGLRGDEALVAVQRFIDDAILMGAQRVRILHGKGNGILRQLIRQYLDSEPGVMNYRDENVQFGGAGITVADLS